MKRRFFQIHLLTALAGMICAALFIGLNLTVFHVDIVSCEPVGGSDLARLSVERHLYMGWPSASAEPTLVDVFSFREQSTPPMWLSPDSSIGLAPAIRPTVPLAQFEKLRPSARFRGERVMSLDDVRRQDPALVNYIVPEHDVVHAFPSWSAIFYWKGMAINAVVALGATLAVMIGIEWFLRQRERAKV